MTSLRLGILSDLHRTTNAGECGRWHNQYDFNGHAARLARALGWFEEEAVDALVLCGDLTHTAEPEAMIAVLGECGARLQVPVFVVSGNHDVARGEDLVAAEIRRSGCERLVLADAAGVLVSGIRLAGVQLLPTSGYMRSRLRALPDLDAWGDEPVVLVSHLPMLSRASAAAARGMPYPGDLLEREHVARPLLARTAPTVVVAGHIHIRDAHNDGPVLQLVQSALIEPPFEASVVEVSTGSSGVLASRWTRRTSDRRDAFEPVLAAPFGSWRFSEGGWAVDDSGSREAPADMTLR